MNNAYFIVRAGITPVGAMPTAFGPFGDEADAVKAAAAFLPGSYQIYDNGAPGKTFTIAAPVVTFDK